jgi:HK97 family phage portal protein
MIKLTERINEAWRALRPSDNEVKSIPPPSIGWGQGYGISGATGLSAMPGWIGSTAGFTNTKIDYVSEVGDLTLSSLVMSAVNFHGTTLPEAPIQVTKTDAEGNRTPVQNHPLVQLLEQPNPFYPGELLWKSFSLDWMTNGNVYWHKRRNGLGKVVQVWPWPAFMVRALWPRSIQEKQLFDAYLDGLGWSKDNSDFISWYELSDGRQWYRVPKEDVVHFRCNVDPQNTRFAMSQLGSVLREIFTDNQRANLNAVLMKNMGIVPWILAPSESGVNLTKEHRDEIKEATVRNTTGDNSGKPLVLGGPMKAVKVALTPKEMLIDNASIIPETRLAAVTGIPAIVLNFWAGLLRGTYANYEAAKRQAYEAKIKPDQRLISGTLRTDLLNEFGDGDHVRFDLSHVQALQEDENQRSKRIEGQYVNGIVMRSEARADLGKGSSDGNPNSDVDKVFAVPRGTSIVQPGEDPVQTPNVSETGQQPKPVKSVPTADVIDEAVAWYEEVAPKEAKDYINATVKSNGGGHVIS